jgi:polyketide biosynthesis enoyl-CoA hydratase PksI
MYEPVVRLTELESGIVQITMEDRINKNAFSDELIRDLADCFERVNKNDDYKVVILTGYDSYFCSGGTKELLLKLQAGKSKFTDIGLYGLLLECKVPVIAAMQGHGIGAGFSFGLFADIIILSRESVYNAIYMKYGFTPGFGATYILPEKLGSGLAEEMLYTAENYRGADLETRGVRFSVLPRSEVVSHAYRIAGQIAEKPRVSLITLKRYQAAPKLEQLKIAIDRELAMHDETFHRPEVRDRIDHYFGK